MPRLGGANSSGYEMAGPIVNLKCRNGCSGILGRAHLEGESVYEGKCRACKEWTTFHAVKKVNRLIPDGQGGFLTLPVND